MLQSGTCSQDRDPEERQRALQDRLDAAVSGLGELDYLRQRQQLLVQAALEIRDRDREVDRRRGAGLKSEEKLLEENILLLRKQLTCLRSRDVGLMSQLQELDRQISDLRLDAEASHDQLETDSRPSSGFYDLSDAASASLSNSSNSVFSECFCSTDTDGRFLIPDDPSGLDSDGLGGLCEDWSGSWSGTVRRSLSAPHPPPSDPDPSDSQSKYQCDLVSWTGSEVYRYPSPLHAVAVQTSMVLQLLGGGASINRDGELLKSLELGSETLKPEPSLLSAPYSGQSGPQSSSWTPQSSVPQSPPHRNPDSYIYSLLQRRAQPIRTSKPRTSISTEPSKGVLRQAGLCGRQVPGPGSGSGLGPLRGSEIKLPWAVEGVVVSSSPQRQNSVETKGDEPETQKHFKPNQTVSALNTNTQSPCCTTNTQSPCCTTNKTTNTQSPCCTTNTQSPCCTNKDPQINSTNLKKKSKEFQSKDDKEPNCNHPCFPPDQQHLYNLKPETDTGDGLVPDLSGSSSQSQDEGAAGGGAAGGGAAGGGEGSHRVTIKLIPLQNVTGVKVKTRTSETNKQPGSDRRIDRIHHRSSSKKSRTPEDSAHLKVSKRAGGGASSSRIKLLPAPVPEGRVPDKHGVRSGVSRHHHGNHHHNSSKHHHQGHHHHHHGRDQVVVVAKPKYKRNDYRRLRAIMEVPYDEAFRRVQRRRRKELLSHAAAVFLPTTEQPASPYAYVAGSDSEYSAECASLFHSTIADTSEDDRSNYTTNRFGDSESSEDEDVEESSTTSDTEESGGGGAGAGGGVRGWSQLTGTRQEMTPAQAKAFVKIKASQNLKKKILRFRSGSLKLMTTV